MSEKKLTEAQAWLTCAERIMYDGMSHETTLLLAMLFGAVQNRRRLAMLRHATAAGYSVEACVAHSRTRSDACLFYLFLGEVSR